MDYLELHEKEATVKYVHFVNLLTLERYAMRAKKNGWYLITYDKEFVTEGYEYKAMFLKFE